MNSANKIREITATKNYRKIGNLYVTNSFSDICVCFDISATGKNQKFR